MMIIDNEFEIGDTVYLKTDIDQCPRIIYSIEVFKKAELIYKLMCGIVGSSHYGFELSRELDVTLKSNA